MSGVGITFDETHSFRDWGLRLKKIVIGIPKAKTEYVSVPGMNGDLDLSEAQNGGVKYEMRTLKFTFGARNCSYERWSGLLSQIASDLQGISKRIILDYGSFCLHWELSWTIIFAGYFSEKRSRITTYSGRRKREEKENDKATDYLKALVGNL